MSVIGVVLAPSAGWLIRKRPSRVTMYSCLLAPAPGARSIAVRLPVARPVMMIASARARATRSSTSSRIVAQDINSQGDIERATNFHRNRCHKRHGVGRHSCNHQKETVIKSLRLLAHYAQENCKDDVTTFLKR